MILASEFRDQNIITTHREHSISILQYNQILLLFRLIVGIRDQAVATSYYTLH